MKKQILYSIILFLACFTGLRAQNFSIVNVDPAAYPQIVVEVSVDGNEQAVKNDFKILEEGKEVPFNFSMQPGGTTSSRKAVCFLIEASGHTYGTPVENFKKAVAAVLETLGEDDLVNVCYFGKANADGRSLNTLSAEFTSDMDLLAGELKSKVTAQKDTNRVADVFKSIYECLDFINSKADLPANKALIVISAAINNSRSPIKADDCIEKAEEYGIPLYTITYKTSNRYAADNFIRISDKTGGKSESAKTSDEISSSLRDFVSHIDEQSVQPGNSYTLDFITSQSGEQNVFEVHYLEQTQQGSFTIPEDRVSFWSANMIWIIVGAALFVIMAGLLIWFFISRRKKGKSENDRLRAMEERNIALQQQLNQQKEVKTQVSPQEPAKFDLKRTQIGGGGGTPMLMVSAGTFSKNFPLNKPQMTIGRGNTNDIIIPETTVSGHHATLINENGNWIIMDNNSTNGTYVNGTRVNRQRIAPTDTIKLGAAFLKLQL